ncbi:MAG: hypothetical protein OHK006_19280 [Thermodesulfovibrionales bacterium]
MPAIRAAGVRKLLPAAALIILASCATLPDYSSPEKTHETMAYAFLTENFDLWLECFDNEEMLKEGFIDISGQGDFEEFKRSFFEKNRLIDSKVLGKKEVSDTEVLLKVQDAFEKQITPRKKYLVKSTAVVKFVRTNDGWKARPTATDKKELKIFKWADGAYIPKEECTRTEAVAAEAVTGYLDSWDDVWKAFNDFGHCDDGSVSEGFDEAVSLLWASRWESITEMAKMAAADSDFRRFLWQRIGSELIPGERWETIVKNAKTRCPDSAKDFCTAVTRAEHGGKKR